MILTSKRQQRHRERLAEVEARAPALKYLRQAQMHVDTAFETLTDDTGENGFIVPRTTLDAIGIADAAEALALAQDMLGMVRGELEGVVTALQRQLDDIEFNQQRDQEAEADAKEEAEALRARLAALEAVREALSPVLECVTEGREPGAARWQRLIDAFTAVPPDGRQE